MWQKKCKNVKKLITQKPSISEMTATFVGHVYVTDVF